MFWNLFEINFLLWSTIISARNGILFHSFGWPHSASFDWSNIRVFYICIESYHDNDNKNFGLFNFSIVSGFQRATENNQTGVKT